MIFIIHLLKILQTAPIYYYAPLRSQSIYSPVKISYFSDIGKSENFHQNSCRAGGKATMRRATILKEIQITVKGVRFKSLFLDLLFKLFVSMLSLCSLCAPLVCPKERYSKFWNSEALKKRYYFQET